MTTIELDPAYPVLWRDARAVQIGTRPAFLVLDDPAPWQLRLLDALARGIPTGRVAGVATAFGAEPPEASDFLARLAPVLIETIVPREISLVTTDRIAHDSVLGVFDALEGAGFAPVRRTAATAADEPTNVAIVLSAELVPPHLAHALIVADVPHLPVALSTSRATVGPLVQPGLTACLACLWEHEKERDPAWPAIASQLLAPTGHAQATRSLATQAGALTARILRDADVHADRTRSVTVSPDGRRRWRSHRPHAACLCRSPRESATAACRIVPRAMTTTGTPSSRHA